MSDKEHICPPTVNDLMEVWSMRDPPDECAKELGLTEHFIDPPGNDTVHVFCIDGDVISIPEKYVERLLAEPHPCIEYMKEGNEEWMRFMTRLGFEYVPYRAYPASSELRNIINRWENEGGE